MKRLSARQELDLHGAARFAEAPTVGEAVFPFVETWVPTVSGRKTRPVLHDDDDTPKGRDDIFSPMHSSLYQKFSHHNSTIPTLFKGINWSTILPANMQNSFWTSKAQKFCSNSLANQTWHKYNAAFQKFTQYLEKTDQKISWPLPESVLNGFVLWCYSEHNISANSVKSYIYGLSKLQQFLGFQPIHVSKSYIATLIKGWTNASNTKKHSKRKMTINLLEKIRRKSKKHLSYFDFTAVWAACCVAFFSSCRMGELLAPSKFNFDKFSTLLWRDIQLSNSKTKIHIKSPKNGCPEKIYLFPVKVKKFCPVLALKELKDTQISYGMFHDDLPVFRLESGHNLTKSFLNKFFRNKVQPNVSCHMFRNAVPSILADIPELVNDAHTMAWGRWRSDAFLDYQKSKSKQKRWLFDKIQSALFD
jgi:hypothetical protein